MSYRRFMTQLYMRDHLRIEARRILGDQYWEVFNGNRLCTEYSPSATLLMGFYRIIHRLDLG